MTYEQAKAIARWLLLLLGCALGLMTLGYFSRTPEERIASEYHIQPKDVHLAGPKPHDCEFDAVPYGNKYCHYEKATELERNDTGKVVAVYQHWNKVED